VNAAHKPARPAGRFAARLAWLTPGAIALTCLLFATLPDGFRPLGRYERGAVLSGELWRLVTGHFVHLGWPHTWMNLAALAVLCLLFERTLSAVDWVVATAAGIAAIDVGFLVLQPDLDWYVGLSGLLHAWVAFGTVELLGGRAGRVDRRLGGILAAGLLAKLAWEHWVGPVPLSAETAGGYVVVSAHLYGAIGGGLAAGLVVAVRRRRGRRL
jgi:rhomboid family GlyGly-CTERM serine protease